MDAAISLGRKEEVVWRERVFGVNPKRTLIRVLIWGYASVLFFHQVFLPIKIVGSSMAPTYQDGSFNFVNRVTYRANSPERGDVVALEWGDEILLKRIVAVPGELVRIKRGQLLINDQPTHDQFADVNIWTEMPPVQLHAHQYFVIGDNRQISVYGRIRQDQILGKLIF